MIMMNDIPESDPCNFILTENLESALMLAIQKAKESGLENSCFVKGLEANLVAIKAGRRISVKQPKQGKEIVRNRQK